MDNDQITALAREYADMLKHLFPDMPEHTYRDKMSQAKNVINIIMRRFCLVEKSKVLKSLIQARALIEVGRRNHDNIKEDLGTGSERTIYCLFPELAKEVEG